MMRPLDGRLLWEELPHWNGPSGRRPVASLISLDGIRSEAAAVQASLDR